MPQTAITLVDALQLLVQIHFRVQKPESSVRENCGCRREDQRARGSSSCSEGRGPRCPTRPQRSRRTSTPSPIPSPKSTRADGTVAREAAACEAGGCSYLFSRGPGACASRSRSSTSLKGPMCRSVGMNRNSFQTSTETEKNYQ